MWLWAGGTTLKKRWPELVILLLCIVLSGVLAVVLLSGDKPVPSILVMTESEAASVQQAVKVHLNSATEAELQTLPQVGPAIAARILAYRSENGPFTAVDELLEVSGIGEVTLEQIRPYVSLD